MFLIRCLLTFLLNLWAFSAAALSTLPDANMAPRQVIFGLQNTPGQAAIPTDLAEGRYDTEIATFTVARGQLTLASAPTAAGQVLLRDEARSLAITISDQHRCVSTSDELEAVLKLAPEDKAGLTICLNPGRYGGFGWWGLRGAFTGIPDGKPIVFQSTDPARPAVLDGFFIGSADERAPGNVILRNLVFEVASPPVADLSDPGLHEHLFAIYIGWQGPAARNVLVENIVVRGPLGEAFKGAHPTYHNIYGIQAKGDRIIIRHAHFETLMNAIHLQGRDILVEHVRGHRLWGDMFQVSPEVLPRPEGRTNGWPCRRSERIVLRNNIMSDIWSNNNRHPDFIHFFASHKVICGLKDVLIEGNIVYLGREGARQPGFPTGFTATAPQPAPSVLPSQPRVVQRLNAPGNVTLPPASCPEERVRIAVQRVPGSGPLSLRPPPGTVLVVNGVRQPAYDLLGDWEVARLTCRPDTRGTWDLDTAKPGPQGIFSNNIAGPDGYQNIIVRHNVLWITSGHGISFGDPDNRNIRVLNNSLLQPFPGDANGDGRPNLHSDGFNERHSGAQIRLEGMANVVRGNISSTRVRGGRQPGWSGNDNGLRHTDSGRSMLSRFTPDPQSGTFMPTTPREAIEKARPRADGMLGTAGIGAVGVRPENDPYDWSWVPDR
ncbi:hypothetical protein [Primorskyibacter sp. S187A]|uniref:hypothetical protein n=1 Tax=Primorskyibacter sp. S187A TaxID=3415130 RepID=UPI003C7CB7AC